MVEAEKKALAAGQTAPTAIDAVRDYFYRGDIAHRIDAFSKANGGLLRYEDMAAFKLQPEEPVSTDISRLQGLQAGILEPGTGDDRSAEYAGRLRSARASASIPPSIFIAWWKRSNSPMPTATLITAIRSSTHIPAATLLSKEYAAERRKADRPQGVARIPARQSSTANARSIPPRWTSHGARSMTR